jgi:hypothetical protein
MRMSRPADRVNAPGRGHAPDRPADPGLSGQGSISDCLECPAPANFLPTARIPVTAWPCDNVEGRNTFIPVRFTFAILTCHLSIQLLKRICTRDPAARKRKLQVLRGELVIFVARATLRSVFPDTRTLTSQDQGFTRKPFRRLRLMVLGREIRAARDAPDSGSAGVGGSSGPAWSYVQREARRRCSSPCAAG